MKARSAGRGAGPSKPEMRFGGELRHFACTKLNRCSELA